MCFVNMNKRGEMRQRVKIKKKNTFIDLYVRVYRVSKLHSWCLKITMLNDSRMLCGWRFFNTDSDIISTYLLEFRSFTLSVSCRLNLITSWSRRDYSFTLWQSGLHIIEWHNVWFYKEQTNIKGYTDNWREH